jgi:hypothetical protein
MEDERSVADRYGPRNGPRERRVTDSVGWTDCLNELAELSAGMSASYARAEPDREADLAVKMLGAVMAAYLQHLWADPVHPAFLPSVGYYQMYGSPNPDTVYRTAAIDGDGEYLITGERGALSDVSIMPFGAPTGAGLQTFPAFLFDDLTISDDGTFEVILSRQEPPSATNWWPLDPQMRTLMLRCVCADWGRRAEPRLAIVRLDGDPRRERLSPAAVTQRLRSFGLVVQGMMMSGVRRVQQLRADNVVNALVEVDYSANGGLARQYYHEGCFELADGEALLVEAQLSPDIESFSISLTDEFFSTIDWANAQSSLNRQQAQLDPDGALRVVVAATDPEVLNWLDTTGHRDGVIQCRWLGGDAAPAIKVTRASIGSLGPALASAHRVTPDERARTIRARQIGVQLRSHW